MQSLTLHARVGKDGILKLKTPIGIANAELEIILVVHPVEKQEKGWPPGFFEQFAGCMPDLPPRAPQGEYETRDELP